MSELWLIDGYNLLYHVQASQNKKSKKDRTVLLARIADFASTGHHQVRVVLDGKGDEQELEVHNTALCRVLYSNDVSADTCIERTLFENKGKLRMTVVTADRAVINMARGSGAGVVRPEEFTALLGDARRASSDVLFKQQSKAHGFSRPFDKKLKPSDD